MIAAARTFMRGPARTLLRDHGARVLRYGMVGLAVSLVHSLMIVACVYLLAPLSPTIASAVSFVILLPLTYVVHRDITFADRAGDRFQFLRFATTTASSFTIAIGGMYVITELLHRSYLLGIAWNWLAIPGVNFLVFMIWVFRHPARDGAAP